MGQASMIDDLRFSVAKGQQGAACAGPMFSPQLMSDKRIWICEKGGWQKGKKRNELYSARIFFQLRIISSAKTSDHAINIDPC
jgi:hypothetical protein